MIFFIREQIEKLLDFLGIFVVHMTEYFDNVNTYLCMCALPSSVVGMGMWVGEVDIVGGSTEDFYKENWIYFQRIVVIWQSD